MKTELFLNHFSKLKEVNDLASEGGRYSSFDDVFKVLELFKGHEKDQVNKVLKKYIGLNFSSDAPSHKVKSILPLVKSIQNFINGCATKTLKTDLANFVHFLESYNDSSIEALLSACKKQEIAKASPKKKQNRQKNKLEQQEIDRIIELLKRAIGHPDTFAEAYKKNRIKDLSVDDVRDIAKGIVSKTPEKASKKKSLELLNERHEELVKYNLKSKSMSGRSAA